MRPGEIQSTVDEGLPEARLRFKNALVSLLERLPVQGGRRVSCAKLLRAMEYGSAKSSLSRYLHGKNVPSKRFVEAFYKTVGNLTATPLPVSLEELLALRTSAEATDRRRREPRQAALARTLEEFKQQLLGPTADKTRSVALPVPHDAGDRQGNGFAEPPTPQAAIEAIQLVEQGQDGQAVTLLSRLSEHLDPHEVAQCVAHFRRRHHDDLADTLIQIYGRDHREDQGRQVIRLSMTLREHQLQKDADILLTMLT